MNNQQILTKAIKKAQTNGFSSVEGSINTPESYADLLTSEVFSSFDSYRLIYRHDFAMALWGDKPLARIEYRNPPEAGDGLIPQWQYQLQQMVTSVDPIKYLAENM